MENKNVKKNTFIFILGLISVVLIFGVISYAFFNYTRTGTANVLKVGRISFVSRQEETINLTNVFPIASSAVDTDTDNVGLLEVEIEGDTDYVNGIEYLVSVTNAQITTGNKTVPISLDIEVDDLGTESANYFTARDSKNASIYKKLIGDTLSGNQQILVGYIMPNSVTGTIEGVDGSITIKAYLDKDKIAISDTYVATGASDYYGTTTEWLGDRVVFTTSEWNALQSTGISFQVKVEANEGIWVIPIIDSCPGCKFVYTTNTYYYSANNYNSAPLSTLTTFESNNETLTDDYRTLNKNIFLGFKFDGSGMITNAYVCGIKGENPNNGKAFCIEGTLSDEYGGDSSTRTTIYNANKDILNLLYGPYDSGTESGCEFDFGVECFGSVGADAYSDGYVDSGSDFSFCDVDGDGAAYCHEY